MGVMSVNITIMAHPKRAHFVEELRQRLDDPPVVWDEENDRWHTGRRALLSYDPKKTWHLVVQDDALLCDDFLPGVQKALAAVKPDRPVSFYTGKTRPYAREIARFVTEAKQLGKHWIEMRGPLWGVAVALPSLCIGEMVRDADEWEIPNYDIRMSEWFDRRRVRCWYSIPSLVDHRVGPENPSLVPGRGAFPGRVAHQFCDESPLDIDWDTGSYEPGDPSEWWHEDFTCTRCNHESEDLAEAITHAVHKHQLGPVDFLASTPHHARAIDNLYKALRADVRGEMYLVGPNLSLHVSAPHTRLQRASARSKLRRKPPTYTIVGAFRDLKLIGTRSGWSLDGYAN